MRRVREGELMTLPEDTMVARLNGRGRCFILCIFKSEPNTKVGQLGLRSREVEVQILTGSSGEGYGGYYQWDIEDVLVALSIFKRRQRRWKSFLKFLKFFNLRKTF